MPAGWVRRWLVLRDGQLEYFETDACELELGALGAGAWGLQSAESDRAPEIVITHLNGGEEWRVKCDGDGPSFTHKTM